MDSRVARKVWELGEDVVRRALLPMIFTLGNLGDAVWAVA